MDGTMMVLQIPTAYFSPNTGDDDGAYLLDDNGYAGDYDYYGVNLSYGNCRYNTSFRNTPILSTQARV